MPAPIHLRVQQVGSSCWFEVSWGQGQRTSRTLEFPAELGQLLTRWQTQYLHFYRTVHLPLTKTSEEMQPKPAEPGSSNLSDWSGGSNSDSLSDSLRGKSGGSGNLSAPPIDWRGELANREAQLLHEFNRWLRREELYDIRAAIAQAAQATAALGQVPVNLYLTCDPTNLARFPWEAWELGTEFAGPPLRIVRVAANLRHPTRPPKLRRRARILVIVGHDERLDLQTDERLLRSHFRRDDLRVIGWREGGDIEALEVEIKQALTDPRGWDVLFFAGHSNEAPLAGGELGIAPKTFMTISAIAPQLAIAIDRGLQFALFNSCKGLDIANSLLDLGFSQVAVMREPIHNRVAQAFLIQFLQGLTQRLDVHQSLVQATHTLRAEQNITYPSAHLVPSFFCHPATQPYTLPAPPRLRPKLHEFIAVAGLIGLSLSPSMQDWLLGQRLLVQAQYRNITRQVATGAPPVLMVQIDPESVRRAGLQTPWPMDRTYLAQLVERLSALEAKVIGIDYLLDQPQPDQDTQLTAALQTAQRQYGTRFVLSSSYDTQANHWLRPMAMFLHPNWALAGDADLYGEPNAQVYHAPLELSGELGAVPPFSYQVARLAQAQWHPKRPPPTPIRPGLLTRLGYDVQQMWLHPIVDFSLPPDRMFQKVPAWQVFDPNPPDVLKRVFESAVMIVPGGYDEAGLEPGQDNLALPEALRYWRHQQNPPDLRDTLPAGEMHAYLFQHFLTGRFATPIPDAWMILTAAIATKLTLGLLGPPLPNRRGLLALTGGTALYALASLQLFVSAWAIALPIVLPAVTVWIYVIPWLWSSRRR
ncbi:CHASE2 domain-containing protein [Thermoleptolyngbya sp. M55_K2018_002]|uniref:CHASE2 domain-containing protein n=1 Tax=Thermoleptolyngbya sp. M55_K2018_002 TaxID=2747808 RepID=UPI0019EC3119|nr:CHASE2 domain-containing protein [Thermoleptolyngbya sp. M55_K2018_002]HIK39879.1 CHASE2 domain-containing protein [Thermoleptolyngbya sp. M55_K2018_002]